MSATEQPTASGNAPHIVVRNFERLILFRLAVCIVVAATLGLSIYRLRSTNHTKPDPVQSLFRLPQGQRFFIAARDDWSDRWTAIDEDDSWEHIEVDERAEQLVRQEFATKGRVRIAKTEEEADFVFLIVIEPAKTRGCVLAEVFPAGCSNDAEKPNCAWKWVAWGDSPADVVQMFYNEVLAK